MMPTVMFDLCRKLSAHLQTAADNLIRRLSPSPKLLVPALIVLGCSPAIGAVEANEKMIKTVTVGVAAEYRDAFNYRTNIYELTLEPLTRIGQFTLALGRESGDTMTVGPLLLPSVDRNHLLTGTTTLRKPSQSWLADKYRLSYGLALPLAGGELLGGVGLGGYSGNTDAVSGLDSKDIDLFEYGGQATWSRNRTRLDFALRLNRLDIDTGSPQYNTIINRREREGSLDLTLPLSATWGVEGGLNYRDKEQKLDFAPLVFPRHRQRAQRVTWRIGANHGKIPGISLLSLGAIINHGEESGSVIARPLGDIGDNLGFYLQAETAGGTKYALTLERLAGHGSESYLTNNRDLTEKLNQSELTLLIGRGEKTLELRHLRSKSSAYISDAGPWEPLLAPFPTGTAPTRSHWRERAWQLALKYPINQAWRLTAEAGLREIDLDQHGLQQSMRERQVKLGVTYTLRP